MCPEFFPLVNGQNLVVLCWGQTFVEEHADLGEISGTLLHLTQLLFKLVHSDLRPLDQLLFYVIPVEFVLQALLQMLNDCLIGYLDRFQKCLDG